MTNQELNLIEAQILFAAAENAIKAGQLASNNKNSSIVNLQKELLRNKKDPNNIAPGHYNTGMQTKVERNERHQKDAEEIKQAEEKAKNKVDTRLTNGLSGQDLIDKQKKIEEFRAKMAANREANAKKIEGYDAVKKEQSNIQSQIDKQKNEAQKQATNNQDALKALANATPASSTPTNQPNNGGTPPNNGKGTSVGQQQQKEEIEPTTSEIHNKNMNEIKGLNLKENAKAIKNNGTITTKEEQNAIKESTNLTKDIDTMYKKGRKSGVLNKLNPFNGYVGLGKTGMYAGAAIGAMMQYKKNMDKWRAQAQYNAMMGLPPPPKPGLVGSLAWGALKGGATGAVVGNVAKMTVGKGLHGNMIQSQRDDMVQSEKYQDMVNKAKTNAGVLQNIINQGPNRPDLQQKMANINQAAANKQLTIEDANYLAKNPHLITNPQINGQNPTIKPAPIFTNQSGWYSYKHGQQNFNMHDYLMSLYETNKYLYQCFSIAEDLEENAVLEMEELTELYNAYATLHEPDNNVSLKAFLDECLIFPNTFVPYVRELVITNKKINYLDNLDTLNELNFSEIQVAPSLVDDFREESKKYQKYCDMYQLYKEHLNPTVDEQTFIIRCRNYPSYYDYIKEKISYNLIYKVDQVTYEFFARTAGGDNIGTTQMPENVKIEGAPGNQEVIDNALANGQDPETADTQNQLSTRKGVKQQEVVDAQKEQNDQNQIAEKEAIAKQTVENAKAKANAQQQKTIAKRQQVTKKLNAEGKDYPPEVLAQKRQEITNLNLKEQQIKANLNAKINQTNDKLEEFKNKKESK